MSCIKTLQTSRVAFEVFWSHTKSLWEEQIKTQGFKIWIAENDPAPLTRSRLIQKDTPVP